MRQKILAALLTFTLAAGLLHSHAVNGKTLGQKTYSDVVFHICPEGMPQGCTHRIEIENKLYRFEATNAEAEQALKKLVTRLQSKNKTSSAPTSIQAFIIQKSGMWPRTNETQDVLEILSLPSYSKGHYKALRG